MGTGLMPKCKSSRGNPPYGRLATSICLGLFALLASSLQMGGGAVTGAHAEEIAEQLYPGRHVSVCKPATFFGCVCETDSPGQVVPFPQLTSEAGDDIRIPRDPEYLRMIDWMRRVCAYEGTNAQQ